MLKMLDGTWEMTASYLYAEETANIGLHVTGLPLKNVGDVLGEPGLAGVVEDGHWNLYLPSLKADLASIALHGGLTGKGVKFGSQTADTLYVQTTLENGRFIIPVEAHRGPEPKGPATLPATLPAVAPTAVANGGTTPNAPTKAAPASPVVLARSGNAPATAPAGDVARAAPEAAPLGVLKATLSAPAADPHHIDVDGLSLSNWPVPLGGQGSQLLAAGGAKHLSIDLPKADSANEAERKIRITTDPVVLTADVRLAGKPAGSVSVTVEGLGRVFDVSHVGGQVLGSTLYGQAFIDLDHPLLIAGEFRADHVDAARLAEVDESFKAVNGTFNFFARIAPARNKEALEPLAMDFGWDASEGAKYANSAELGSARMRAYLNLDQRWGLVRAVLEDEKKPAIPPVERPGKSKAPPDRPEVPDVNTIHLAGGVMKVWGRVVRNEDEAGRRGRDVDVDAPAAGVAVVRPRTRSSTPATPPAGPMQGRMDGQVNLYGSTGIYDAPPAKTAGPGLAAGRSTGGPGRLAPSQRPVSTEAAPNPNAPFLERLVGSLYGSGAVELQQTNLANFSVISFLYNAMHLGGDMNAPTGNGDATFRVEAGKLDITALHYFNRGVEVRALATVRDLKKIPDSPIAGSAVGSIRPLKNINLPGFIEVDQILRVLQSSATSVSIGGTVRHPSVSIILFGDLGQEMREFLTGDIKMQTQGSAGQ